MADTTIKKVESKSSPRGEMGQKYLVAGKRVSMRLWSLETGTELARGRRHQKVIVSLALGPDEKLLASAGHDGVWLWEGDSGKEVGQLETRETWCVAFHPDGARLASAGRDGVVRLWDLAARQPAASGSHMYCSKSQLMTT